MSRDLLDNLSADVVIYCHVLHALTPLYDVLHINVHTVSESEQIQRYITVFTDRQQISGTSKYSLYVDVPTAAPIFLTIQRKLFLIRPEVGRPTESYRFTLPPLSCVTSPRSPTLCCFIMQTPPSWSHDSRRHSSDCLYNLSVVLKNIMRRHVVVFTCAGASV